MASNLIEFALRAATNTNSRDLNLANKQPDAIQDTILQYLVGNQEVGDASQAIGLALANITLVYLDISHEFLVHKRLAFAKESALGYSSMMLPDTLDLSLEEKVIKGFIELANKSPSFSKYLGIHSADWFTDISCKYYTVVPFSRMSDGIVQAIAGTTPLDRLRTAISLFFNSTFLKFMDRIDKSFQTELRVLTFWKCVYQGRNYLNNKRAPRFIMMCLANLLWNIEYPVDPETGFPLGLTRSIEICKEVEMFLNQLLEPKSPPYMESINDKENDLISFVHTLAIYVKELGVAFAEKQRAFTRGAAGEVFSRTPIPLPQEIGEFIGGFLDRKTGGRLAQVCRAAYINAKKEQSNDEQTSLIKAPTH